jgi:hypothetical protein
MPADLARPPVRLAGAETLLMGEEYADEVEGAEEVGGGRRR